MCTSIFSILFTLDFNSKLHRRPLPRGPELDDPRFVLQV
jgi:hypothetical protein